MLCVVGFFLVTFLGEHKTFGTNNKHNEKN